jgi:hypothetical protein
LRHHFNRFKIAVASSTIAFVKVITRIMTEKRRASFNVAARLLDTPPDLPVLLASILTASSIVFLGTETTYRICSYYVF